MAKTRPSISKAVHDAVLDEYNHLCAVCGAVRPQLHHIDEKPANNDPLNLLPLCPNCHLTDQHNPTRRIELGILQLFRRYKDPAILSPQFGALYKRFKYLDCVQTLDRKELETQVIELQHFIEELEMGKYYSRKLRKVLILPSFSITLEPGNPAFVERDRRNAQEDRERYNRTLPQQRETALELIMELLHFQNWLPPKGNDKS